jgi:hypothetical protein
MVETFASSPEAALDAGLGSLWQAGLFIVGCGRCEWW